MRKLTLIWRFVPIFSSCDKKHYAHICVLADFVIFNNETQFYVFLFEPRVLFLILTAFDLQQNHAILLFTGYGTYCTCFFIL